VAAVEAFMPVGETFDVGMVTAGTTAAEDGVTAGAVDGGTVKSIGPGASIPPRP